MVGTAIPFVMFVLWDAALLGSVSQADADAINAAVARSGGAIELVADPLLALQATSPTAAALVSAFSFFAITTSFLGFVLGLVDFLGDGLGFNKENDDVGVNVGVTGVTSSGVTSLPGFQQETADETAMNTPTVIYRPDCLPVQNKENGNDPRSFALALFPPLAFALSYPDVFLDALDSAGTFGVLTLFGCMPPAMAWVSRGYGTILGGLGSNDSGTESGVARKEGFASSKLTKKGTESTPNAEHDEIVPGGKPVLVGLFSFAASVVFGESVSRIGGLVFDR